MKTSNFKNKQIGFTLIETMVAVMILFLIVLGPIALLAMAIGDGAYAKNQTVASYLAQEGADLVIYKLNYLQEKNRLNPDDSENMMDQINPAPGCNSASDNCRIYFDNSSNEVVIERGGGVFDSQGDLAKLKICQSGPDGQYNYCDSVSNLVQTPFNRRIWFEQVSGSNNADQRKMVVEVKWRNNSLAASSVRISRLIFNMSM